LTNYGCDIIHCVFKYMITLKYIYNEEYSIEQYDNIYVYKISTFQIE